jgi:type II secretory pathway pseudopilin PulG
VVSAARQRGFTFPGLLVVIVVLGLMLTVVGRIWSTSERREREIQLLFAGHAYRLAIGAYFANGHRYPASLEELLNDQRWPIARHHLRRLYPDPMTGRSDWSLILTPDGQGIMGVASVSQGTPLKRAHFDLEDSSFKDAECYCEWQFVYYANRFNRASSPVDPGASPARPANQTNTLGEFSPGHLTTLPTGAGRLAAPDRNASPAQEPTVAQDVPTPP